MQVQKRNGSLEPVHFDKISKRIELLCHDLCIDPISVAQEVIHCLVHGITTKQLDEETARICSLRADQHPDYLQLAARITISNFHKSCQGTFSQKMATLFAHRVTIRRQDEKSEDPQDSLGQGKHSLLLPDFAAFVNEHADALNAMVHYDRDYAFDYFGFKTLQRSYLMKCDGAFVESPQDMFMRVATFLYYTSEPAEERLTKIQACYDGLSTKQFIHATPTLFNSGTRHPQLLSCFLGGLEDSVKGIYEGLTKCALLSKHAGGIGLHVSNLRSRGAYIHGTNGYADGLVPVCRVFNESTQYINQASKRNGSIAMYVEPHHPDILSFLSLKRNHGKQEERARSLFYALWISDLFMERVQNNQTWSLFDPSECPGLDTAFGSEYEALYLRYEQQKRYMTQLPARDVWKAMLVSQVETGVPYIGYKDHVNRKNNQANLGVIRSSNLCIEIVEYSDEHEFACCTLASMGLPTFVKGSFDFESFRTAVRQVVRNLNRVIDLNYYPIEEARKSNVRHRPIAIGIQGLADVFVMLKMPFDSPEAAQLNRQIAEHMYFAAMQESIALAKVEGAYSSFEGSPLSKGLFQFDLWEQQPTTDLPWDALRQEVLTHGARNSLLIALMPTASTSQILGYNECFEPFTSNFYSRRTLAGEFVIVNKYLIQELMEHGLWNQDLRSAILRANGSVQGLPIPEDIKARYKTVWEISQKVVMDMARDRAPFVCQTQSMNLFKAAPTLDQLSSMHFYAWKQGLKTGMYYLRTLPKVQTDQFALEKVVKPAAPEQCDSCSA